MIYGWNLFTTGLVSKASVIYWLQPMRVFSLSLIPSFLRSTDSMTLDGSINFQTFPMHVAVHLECTENRPMLHLGVAGTSLNGKLCGLSGTPPALNPHYCGSFPPALGWDGRLVGGGGGAAAPSQCQLQGTPPGDKQSALTRLCASNGHLTAPHTPWHVDPMYPSPGEQGSHPPAV